jgi:hypothetical protein
MRYPTRDAIVQFYQALNEHSLRCQEPGGRAISLRSAVSRTRWTSRFPIVPAPPPDEAAGDHRERRLLRAAGIRVFAGRAFSTADTATAARSRW